MNQKTVTKRQKKMESRSFAFLDKFSQFRLQHNVKTPKPKLPKELNYSTAKYKFVCIFDYLKIGP